MAICNTFGELKNTGTFLTFSQYMEDLTKWQTESIYHKIVPSKFIAIKIPKSNLNNFGNGSLPRLFVEKFENACACFKNLNDFEWIPEYSKTLFWDTVFNSGLINMSDINYVGDINLQSYNNVDGMGYSEIYCHIPDNAAQYTYSNEIKPRTDAPNSITKQQNDLLEGFTDVTDDESKLTDDYEYSIKNQYEFSWNQSSNLDEPIRTNNNSFDINTIIVLYDILNDGSSIASDIPMGIYFTGSINDDGEIQNSITKYVSNEEIFGAGTSYGLRICSRYVVASESNSYSTQTVTCEDNNYSDLSRVLTQLSISQNKMDRIVNTIYSNQNYKTLLSLFKNQKVNVPYIKYINGEKYWFVNGKMIDSAESQLISLPNNPQMYIIATATNNDGRYIFKKGESHSITINAAAYENGVELNGVTFGGLGTYENVNTTTEYNITATYCGRVATAKTKVYFVSPTYVGCMDSNNFTPNTSNLNSLQEYLFTSKTQTHNITTTNSQYIVLLYPAEYGEITSIMDQNNLNISSSFTKSTKSITLNGTAYYMYISNNKATITNYTIQIN